MLEADTLLGALDARGIQPRSAGIAAVGQAFALGGQ